MHCPKVPYYSLELLSSDWLSVLSSLFLATLTLVHWLLIQAGQFTAWQRATRRDLAAAAAHAALCKNVRVLTHTYSA